MSDVSYMNDEYVWRLLNSSLQIQTFLQPVNYLQINSDFILMHSAHSRIHQIFCMTNFQLMGGAQHSLSTASNPLCSPHLDWMGEKNLSTRKQGIVINSLPIWILRHSKSFILKLMRLWRFIRTEKFSSSVQRLIWWIIDQWPAQFFCESVQSAFVPDFSFVFCFWPVLKWDS